MTSVVPRCVRGVPRWGGVASGYVGSGSVGWLLTAVMRVWGYVGWSRDVATGGVFRKLAPPPGLAVPTINTESGLGDTSAGVKMAPLVVVLPVFRKLAPPSGLTVTTINRERDRERERE